MNQYNNISVAIIDYGLGNLYSVKRACEEIGMQAEVTSDNKDILKADALILPGVGAFSEAMQNLTQSGMADSICAFVESGKPFMGICLGMQLLFSGSEEFGTSKGMGLIPGEVIRFPNSDTKKKIKVPQVGWNQIRKPALTSKLWDISPLNDIVDGTYMYFVHSFYSVPQQQEHILSETEYEGIKYCSAVMHNNIVAFQFHPEKSGPQGIKIYKNWINKMFK